MKTERKSLSKKTRFEVFKRDRFTCQYCGSTPPSVVLVVDHVEPVAGGGTDEIDNLVSSCESCNQGKGARPLGVVPESLAQKSARIVEAEEQLQGYQQILRARAERLTEETWEVAERLWPGSGERGAKRAHLQSIKRFIERLGVVEVLDLVDVAIAAKPYPGNAQWLYFCGCCWRRIRELQGEE